MATVYRRTRRKPIPQSAEVVESRGKRFAVWRSRGRRRRAALADDGQTVLVEDGNYTVEWFNWQGKRQRTTGGPDKDAAEALGAKLEAEEMQRRRGLDVQALRTCGEKRGSSWAANRGQTRRPVGKTRPARPTKRTSRKSLRCREMRKAGEPWRLPARVETSGLEPPTPGLQSRCFWAETPRKTTGPGKVGRIWAGTGKLGKNPGRNL